MVRRKEMNLRCYLHGLVHLQAVRARSDRRRDRWRWRFRRSIYRSRRRKRRVMISIKFITVTIVSMISVIAGTRVNSRGQRCRRASNCRRGRRANVCCCVSTHFFRKITEKLANEVCNDYCYNCSLKQTNENIWPMMLVVGYTSKTSVDGQVN